MRRPRFRRHSKERQSKRRGNLISVGRILLLAARQFRQHWSILVRVSALVTVPAALLQLIPLVSTSQLLQAYLAVASLIMSVALLWTILQLNSGRRITVRQAYYDGTGALVKFILVFSLLSLQMLPMVFGATIYAVGSASVISTAERVIFALIWLLLSIPSAWWLVRNIFGVFIVFESGMTPVNALRASRALVKGRFWPVLGRLAVIGVLLAGTLLGLLIGGTALITNQPVLLSSIQLLANLLLLPLFYLCVNQLYLHLKDSQSGTTP